MTDSVALSQPCLNKGKFFSEFQSILWRLMIIISLCIGATCFHTLLAYKIKLSTSIRLGYDNIVNVRQSNPIHLAQIQASTRLYVAQVYILVRMCEFWWHQTASQAIRQSYKLGSGAIRTFRNIQGCRIVPKRLFIFWDCRSCHDVKVHRFHSGQFCVH